MFKEAFSGHTVISRSPADSPINNIYFISYLHFSGQYLVLATQETINIYLVMTGGMLGVVTRHYQPVTLLRSVQYHQYSTVSSVQYSTVL